MDRRKVYLVDVLNVLTIPFIRQRSSSAFDISIRNYCCLYYCVIDQNDESILITFPLSLSYCVALTSLQILWDNSWSIRSIPIGLQQLRSPQINGFLHIIIIISFFFFCICSSSFTARWYPISAFLLFAPGPFDDVRRRASQQTSCECVRYICVCMGASLSHMASNPSRTHPRGATGGTFAAHTHTVHSFPSSLFSHSLTHSPIKECLALCSSFLEEDFLFSYEVCDYEVRLELWDEYEIKTVE